MLDAKQNQETHPFFRQVKGKIQMMRPRHFKILSAVLLATITALGTYSSIHLKLQRKPASDTQAFTYESLLQLAQDKKIQSIDQLLPLLPQNFRDNYATIYRTRSSLQEASESNPRLLLYSGTDAKLLMTFNGSSTQKGYDSLEVIQFRDETQRFEFHEVRFPVDPTNLPEKNPAACMQCHADPVALDPRPNWDSYFLWPGLIGSHDGDIFARDQDRASAMDWAHGRYQFVKNNLPVSEPNSNLSQLLGLLNGQRLARMIRENSGLFPLRFAILGAVTCSDGRYDLSRFLPAGTASKLQKPYAAVLADTILKNRNYYQQKLHQIDTDLSPLAGPSALTGKRATDPMYADHGDDYSEQIARLRYLVEGSGVSMARWNLTFDLDTNSFNDGGLSVLNPDWWASAFNAAEDSDIQNALAADKEKISEYFDSLDSSQPEPAPPEYISFCDNLAAKSLAALGQSPVVPQPVIPQPAPTSTIPSVVQLCMGCHVGSNLAAPAIPFDQPVLLAAWLNSKSADGTKKSDLLLSKISNAPVSGSRMPPFRVLAPVEKAALEAYLHL